MKVSFGNLHNSREALPILASTKLPMPASYRIGRVLTSSVPELEVFHKAHVALLEKHGAVADEAGKMDCPKENLVAFTADFNLLLNEECELWGDPIHPDLLGSAEIEPAVLATLSWLITDGTSAPEKAQAVNG